MAAMRLSLAVLLVVSLALASVDMDPSEELAVETRGVVGWVQAIPWSALTVTKVVKLSIPVAKLGAAIARVIGGAARNKGGKIGRAITKRFQVAYAKPFNPGGNIGSEMKQRSTLAIKQGIQDVVANLAKEELKIATKQGLKVFEEHNKLE